jgi:hypothetical protein
VGILLSRTVGRPRTNFSGRKSSSQKQFLNNNTMLFVLFFVYCPRTLYTHRNNFFTQYLASYARVLLLGLVCVHQYYTIDTCLCVARERERDRERARARNYITTASMHHTHKQTTTAAMGSFFLHPQDPQMMMEQFAILFL